MNAGHLAEAQIPLPQEQIPQQHVGVAQAAHPNPALPGFQAIPPYPENNQENPLPDQAHNGNPAVLQPQVVLAEVNANAADEEFQVPLQLPGNNQLNYAEAPNQVEDIPLGNAHIAAPAQPPGAIAVPELPFPGAMDNNLLMELLFGPMLNEDDDDSENDPDYVPEVDMDSDEEDSEMDGSSVVSENLQDLLDDLNEMDDN